MAGHYNRREREEMNELLKAYNGLKSGRHIAFLEEDDFERIIDYFDDKEDPHSALEASKVGLLQFPYSAMLRFKSADMLITLKQYAQALEVLEEAELYDPNDISLYILKTDAFLALDMPQKAAAILEEALDIYAGDDRIDLLFELTDVYDDYEQFGKVFECLKLILEEDPENEEALLKICFWADFTSRSEESIQLHHWIIDQNPFNELAWFNLATSYQSLKLYEKAIDSYLYALAIDEKLDIAYRNMGDAYIRLRKYKEAIEVLSKVLELSRPEDVIYEAIGHCYHKQSNWALARFNYRKASHLNAEDSRLNYKIAITYYKESQWVQAVKQLEVALKIQRNQPEYLVLMGECKLELGNTKEAIICFTEAVILKPKSITCREALISALLDGDLAEEAYTVSIQSLEMTNQNPIFMYSAAAALFSLGKTKEALLQLEIAFKKNPKGFKKLTEWIPSILQRSSVVELANIYLRKR